MHSPSTPLLVVQSLDSDQPEIWTNPPFSAVSPSLLHQSHWNRKRECTLSKEENRMSGIMCPGNRKNHRLRRRSDVLLWVLRHELISHFSNVFYRHYVGWDLLEARENCYIFQRTYCEIVLIRHSAVLSAIYPYMWANLQPRITTTSTVAPSTTRRHFSTRRRSHFTTAPSTTTTSTTTESPETTTVPHRRAPSTRSLFHRDEPVTRV